MRIAAPIALLAATASVTAAAQTLAEYQFRSVTQGQMDAALRDCGLQHFTIHYEQDWQSDVIAIRDNQVSDAELLCAFEAQDWTGYFLEWEPEVASRYHAITTEIFSRRAEQRARQYFAQHPEFGPLPMRKQGESEIDFARELERFCGPLANGMFTDEYGPLTISPSWIIEGNIEERAPALTCIRHASALTELGPISFIGNEKQPDAEPADQP